MNKIIIKLLLFTFLLMSFHTAFAQQVCIVTGETVMSQNFNEAIAGEPVSGANCSGWGTYLTSGTQRYVSIKKDTDRTNSGNYVHIYNNGNTELVQLNLDNNCMLPTQCYQISFWAKKDKGTSYFYLNDRKDYDDDFSVEIDAAYWKEYTFTIGPTGMDELVDFAYPTDFSGNLQLQFSPGGDENEFSFYIDDFSIRQISFISHNFNHATKNGEDVLENTCNNWGSYREDGVDKYVRLESAADRDGGGYGVHVYNRNSMNFVQLNHKAWSEKEALSMYQSYRVTFWAKVNSGNAQFRINDIADYTPDYSFYLDENAKEARKTTEDGWTEYSFLMGPDGKSDDMNFVYPSNHSGNFQIQLIPDGRADETIDFYVDDFTIQKVNFEESDFSVTHRKATYSDLTDVGAYLVNGKDFVAKVDVSNKTAYQKQATVILARYNKENDKLVDVSCGETGTFQSGEQGTAEAVMSLPENENLTEQKIKVFVFSSISKLVPIAETEKYPNREKNITTVADVDLNYMIDSKYVGDFYIEPMYELGFPYVFYPW